MNIIENEQKPLLTAELLPVTIFLTLFLILIITGFFFLHFGLDLSFQEIIDANKPEPLKRILLNN